MDGGLLVLPSQHTHARFYTKKLLASIEYVGCDIGEITNFAECIPCKINDRLFYYVDPMKGGLYFLSRRYDPIDDLVEQLKYIFEIPILPYNICKINGRSHFIYECYPEYENEFLLTSVNPKKLTDNERLIGIFHWIIGAKGKYWIRNTTWGNYIYSKGPYVVDFDKTNLTKIAIKRFLPNLEYKRSYGLFFNTEQKLDLLRDLLYKHHYTWYRYIFDRLYLLN